MFLINYYICLLYTSAKKIKASDDVDLHTIARMASGASGAELANIINEAASVSYTHLDVYKRQIEAYEKIISNIQEDDLAVTRCTLRKIRQLMEGIK